MVLEQNAPIIRLMLECQTQWRMSMAGATGLDYNAVFKVAEVLGIELNSTVLAGIRTVEGVTLEHWRKQEKEKGGE